MTLRLVLPLLSLLVLGLGASPGCERRSSTPPPVAPVTGSSYVAPPGQPAAASPEVASEPPLLLRAVDVGSDFDELVTDPRVQTEYTAGDPWIGADEPTATLVVYLDYECPFSRNFMPTLYELAELYPRDLRVVIKHFPLDMHPHAREAAIAAQAAYRQGRFWAYHDTLFSHPDALDRQSLLDHAGRLGFDLHHFGEQLDDPALAALVDDDLKKAQSLGIRGTPAVYLNGKEITDGRELENMRTQIDAEVALAHRLLEAGAERRALYAHFMHAATAGPRPPAAGDDEVARIQVDTTGLPRKGAADPKVVIVECSDFDCPFCARVVPTLDELLAAHPDEVALFYRHMPLPFHQGAEPAARAAVAAQQQGKFWEMHAQLFDHQQSRSNAQLEKLARKAGLNIKKFRRDFKAQATAERVATEKATCEANGIRGTPGFLINGRHLAGARPLADFEEVIQEELDRAR